MGVARSVVVFTSILVILTVVPKQSDCRNMSLEYVATECGQEVVLGNIDGNDLVVNLTFDQTHPHGALCSWLIPAGNATMSNQIVITDMANPDALACNNEVFSVSEQDPATGSLNCLKLECVDHLTNANQSRYSPVVGRPGLSILVTLNTTSALSGNFVFMYVLPFVWKDEVCPRHERKVVIVHPGIQDDSDTYNPASAGLLSRFPDNLECKWEFRSPDEGLVHLQIRTFSYGPDESHVCGGGDHFVLTNQNTSASPVIVPLCKDPGIRFDYSSTSGSVFVTMRSDNSSGAYQYFYFKYWSVESCPSIPLRLKVYFNEKHMLKGSSFSPQGAGQEQTCQWEIRTRTSTVVKLYPLETRDFLEDCDNKDYLIVNGHEVSICNGSMFPVWSEGQTMNITLHTRTTALRRSFLLNYTSVLRSPCQGYPERRTVQGSRYMGEYVVLMPIPQGDIQNGQVCQWLFTAKDKENAVIVSVDWATDKDGVNFNKETCSYANFRVYDGNIANNSAEITPTCSADKSSIMYTSTSRDMLFVYHRESDVAESGFSMKVNQVSDSTSGGSSGRDGSRIIWATVLLGVIALLLSFEN